MHRPQPQSLVHGAIGGLAAGAVVALWLLIVDAVTATPFDTPRHLASAILGVESTTSTARIVAAYTVLHFGVFALLGIGAAWALRAFALEPGLLLGVLFGIAVLNTVHYGALLITGRGVLAVLPPRHVLPANLLGGMVLMAYLHYAMRSQRRYGLGVLREHQLLERGMITGLIGAGAVALWFLILDVVRGAPFFTPAALASAVFFGAESPADVRVTPGVVFGFTVLHVAVFCAVGVVIVWCAERLERMPSMWLMGLMAFIMLAALSIGLLASMSNWVLGAMGVWAVVIANLVAILAMGAWVWRTHPTLRHELLDHPVKTLV